MARDQLSGLPGVKHPARAHRDHAVAQRLGLVDLVRHKQHRRAGVA